MLAADVEGTVDLGPTDRRSGVVVHGAQPVARNVLRYFGSWTTLVEIPGTATGVVAGFVARRLYAVMVLSTRDDAVDHIDVTADPAKLAHLGALV